MGEVNGKMVGVMLLQNQGYLTCLEVYDLSDIEYPYGLPDLTSLKPFNLRQENREYLLTDPSLRIDAESL